MSQSPVIETSNLRKEFNGKVAVSDLTLRVGQGEVFGFLGPNGAGKTTSIKMLLGLVAPTRGEGRLLGRPIGDPRARARAGFLPEHFRFHDWLTGAEFLHLHGRLYGMQDADRRRRVPELLERVGLKEHADRRLRGYSKGMLQRVGLAQALLNRPAVVFLDEPTSGLDPLGRILVRDMIRDMRQEGTTVFLNSHLLSEVEITCDRVVFIKQGAVVKVVSLDELEKGAVPVEIRVGRVPADAAAGLAVWGRDIRVEGDRLYLVVDSESLLPDVARWLVGQGIDLYTLTPRRASLEDLFLQIVGVDGGL